MAHDDERFTPEEVDEQVERLTDAFHVTPPAQPSPDTQLIDTLQRLYPPDEADARSLERVWHRLERRGVAPRREEPRKIAPLEGTRFRRERHRLMKDDSVLSGTGQKLSLRIARIAALFLLVALIGGLSIGLVLVHHGGNGAGTAGAVTTRTATPAPQTPMSVYVGAYGGVYKLDSKTGKLLWSYPVGNNVPPVVAAEGNMVYVGSQGGLVQALDASTGKLLWKKVISHFPDSSAQIAVADGVIYVGSESDGSFYALNASDGSVRWHVQMTPDISGTGNPSAIFSVVTVVNGVLYGTFSSLTSTIGYLYAINARDGSFIWKKLWSNSQQELGGLVFADNTLYATSSEISHHSGIEPQDSYAYAFNPANGDMLWQSKKTNGFVLAAPAVGNGGVYFGAQQDGVYAVSAKDGSPLWHVLAGANIYPSPQVANGVIYVGQTSNNGASGNYLVALSSSTGQVLWQHPLVNYLGHSEFAVLQSVVYVTTDDGYLYALSASDGSQLWRSRYFKTLFPMVPGSVTFGP